MELSPVAARIVGCLLEKARTTPDQYPLSLNALVTACNQTTNRSPVVSYDDAEVESGLDELRALELVRREKPHGGRAIKYSELVRRVIPMGEPELAVLCVLLLRGPQTPGELKARSDRLYAFANLESLEVALRRLAGHEDGPFAEQQEREPGRKEARWRECLSAGSAARVAGGGPIGVPGEMPGVMTGVTNGSTLMARVAALEAEVARLASALDGLAPEGRD